MSGASWFSDCALVWLLCGIVLLYMARKQEHQAIKGFWRGLRNGFRLSSQVSGALDDWRGKVESGQGSWRVVNDLDRLERILAR